MKTGNSFRKTILRYKVGILVFFAMSFSVSLSGKLNAQSLDDGEPNILYRYERSGFGILYHDGWGAGYRQGKSITGFKRSMFEVEVQFNRKHSKEVKSQNILFNNSRRYVYGKLNYFSILRGGMGLQKVLNDKPYWGGVQLRYYYGGGFTFGLIRPYYIYIINYTETPYEFYLTDERYDPEKHFISDIYGRGPFGKGFGKMRLFPGIYSKFAFNFEFGDYEQEIRSLEAGMLIDVFLLPIPMMAYDSNKQIFLSLFINFHLGKRYNE